MKSNFKKNFTEEGYLMKYLKPEKKSGINNQVLQFKIELMDIEPLIWRRIFVPVDYNFWDLHVAVQDSMGWDPEKFNQNKISFEDPYVRWTNAFLNK